MNKITLFITVLSFVFCVDNAKADEGMWMLNKIDEKTAW